MLKSETLAELIKFCEEKQLTELVKGLKETAD